MSVLELFCHGDDFCQWFEPQWQQTLLREGAIKRIRRTELTASEIMTIVIHFHQSHYRDFKAYYQDYVQRHYVASFLSWSPTTGLSS